MAAEEINKPPSLPPYPEMILSAIEALNEGNGSNKTSISKYIESNYGDLPAGHIALLSHHLNRMKDTGEIVFWKNNYSKPDPNAPPRRGRGRPPKPKDPLSPASSEMAPARPRGRPPKRSQCTPKASEAEGGDCRKWKAKREATQDGTTCRRNNHRNRCNNLSSSDDRR
ncbi:hypothetical protein OIU77_001403 [Salix suchowensis]|uniref:H15 domain-containing protein n=1 Tax=Salix suchowensis TaxID=1278906 RepID=A0ABQ9B1A4_9ROSI|nr:hypothetical protein OIU77_001403 [Salix suchowensis]